MKIRNIIALSVTTLLFACSVPDSSGYTAEELNSEISNSEYAIVELWTEICSIKQCPEYKRYLRDSLKDDVITRREYHELDELYERTKRNISVKRLKDAVDS